MKILYQINSLETVYAARFIYEGYKHAFGGLGHTFRPFTSSENLEKVLLDYSPNIFISSLNRYNLKFIDLNLLHKHRDKGLVFFNQISPWKKQNSQYGGSGLGEDKELVELIKSDLAGDIFFHWLEQDDPSMDGFEKTTGKKFYTILLAADPYVYFYDYDDRYVSDISFVGSFLPDKRDFIRKHLFPLRKKYNVKVYGSDWTLLDRTLGYVQKVGQYFNIDPLKHIRKLKLPLDDERKIYSSSTISLNMHENHQRKFGSDFNERTLKIIASGGFEICDNIKVIRKYFSEDELVIAENTDDWFEKIDYYMKNPDKREPIIKKGRKKVLSHHAYCNRAEQFIGMYREFTR